MASTTATLRKDLSAPGMIAILRKQFSKIEDRRRQASIRFSLPDTLCAALAMFQFKSPSLLQFDEAYQTDEVLMGNLLRLYSLDKVASDTQMRAILDEVKPSELRPAFRALHSSAQRGKVLEDFAIFDNRLLLSIDGTGPSVVKIVDRLVYATFLSSLSTFTVGFSGLSQTSPGLSQFRICALQRSGF
jgi:hypothetical protein